MPPAAPWTAALRKRAALNKRIREARLYVSALGVYEAYVNGRQVTVPQDGATTIELLPPGSTKAARTWRTSCCTRTPCRPGCSR
ncbi:alpha-L-rhamnosidase N-terminal domain-containing protein [Streptomyces sp. NPDC002817]|uniref:alpha-L-rhamnosidase N-terminal domain-containing protein n=1 Tax=Streptomyces sp. NPDC088357 TaxID=3154655 RepID=UPI003444A385